VTDGRLLHQIADDGASDSLETQWAMMTKKMM